MYVAQQSFGENPESFLLHTFNMGMEIPKMLLHVLLLPLFFGIS